jgi:asparagine synthase (glutamine-hydrolysing)
MCGIAGIVGSCNPDNELIVKKMTRSLIHRGPDDEGFWNQDQVYFGHRRLSIIDIKGGRQPFVIERGGKTHAVVYNGEIYNYRTISNKLSKQGVYCETNSDTEVLLRLLMNNDIIEALDDIEGMFAFAWWDADHNRLFLVRDRMGIKPLYYHYGYNGVLSFSSSLESLICNPSIERKLDMEGFGYFLTMGYTPSPLTMYSGIYELEPGHMLLWENGNLSIKKYWEIDWNSRFNGTEDEAAEHLNGLLDDVVKDHLVSDVAVGAFLSGGIDSSTIVSRSSRFVEQGFSTFTISFPDELYDESSNAHLVAKHLGVRNQVIPMETMPVDEHTCRFILKHVGQPFADSSCLPSYLVSSAASKEIKVVLSGDGGDELFAGYEIFNWGEKVSRIKAFPEISRKLMLYFISLITPPKFLGDRYRQIRKGLSYSLRTKEEILFNLKTIIDNEQLISLTSLFGMMGPDHGRVRKYLFMGRNLDFSAALGRFLTEISLPGDMLRKMDSMSMASSIEVRVPLLDRRIVEFAQSLPLSMKIKGGVRKALLKKVVRKELPNEIFSNPKWGFSIPLHKAFNKDFLLFCRQILCSHDSRCVYIFGRDNIEKILFWNEQPNNPVPHMWSIYTVNHLLWMMIQLEMWLKEKNISMPDDAVS